METLMTGIKSVHLQCCKQQQQMKKVLSSPQTQNVYSSIRRVRSSATPSKRPTYLSMANNHHSPSTYASCSQECLTDSPNLSQDTGSTLSASSLNSLNSQPIMMRQRSESAAASLRFKSNKPPVLAIHVSSSSSMEEAWIPATPIHELPESPKIAFSSPFSVSSVSLHSQKSADGFRRSTSMSSPPSSSGTLRHSHLVTSTPNISQPYEKRDYYHTLPSTLSTHRNSLPESVMNTVIPEDQVDNSSISDSLSQLSTCTDEGSPQNSGSTVIVRRSSLTGQIEHYRRPRPLNKKNSASMDLCEKPASEKADQTGQARLNSATGTKEEFKVLNRGYKSKRKSKRMSVILPSIETTV